MRPGFSAAHAIDDRQRQPRGGVHGQEEGDEVGRADRVLAAGVLRDRSTQRHLDARRAQPRRRRRQPERLAAQVVGANRSAGPCTSPIVILQLNDRLSHACRRLTSIRRCDQLPPIRRRRRPTRSRLLRPSARALHAVLHRDVGALQLLRHARAAHPVHDRAGRQRRARVRRRDGRRGLRPLHLDGVHERRCRAAGLPIG